MFESEYDMPFDDWEEEELFVCAVCGKRFARPPLIIFRGEGDAMTATEYCPACFGQVTGHRVIMTSAGEVG